MAAFDPLRPLGRSAVAILGVRGIVLAVVETRTHTAFVMAVAAVLLGSCHAAPRDAYSDRASFCAVQVCDTKFEALSFDGEGQLLVRLGEHGRFYLVDSRTSDRLLNTLKYVPDTSNADATGYTGTLDAEFVWSKPMISPVLWIRKIQGLRPLFPAERQSLLRAFGQSQ